MWIMNQELNKLVHCEAVNAVPLDNTADSPIVFRNEKHEALGVYRNPLNKDAVMEALLIHLQNEQMIKYGKSRIYSDDEISKTAVFFMPRETIAEPEKAPEPVEQPLLEEVDVSFMENPELPYPEDQMIHREAGI